jgi:hypothetical protein
MLPRLELHRQLVEALQKPAAAALGIFEKGLASYGGHFTSAAAVGCGYILSREKTKRVVYLEFTDDVLRMRQGHPHREHGGETELPPWLKSSGGVANKNKTKLTRKAQNITAWANYFRTGKLSDSNDGEVWASRLLGTWAVAAIKGGRGVNSSTELFIANSQRYLDFANSESDSIIALHTFLEAAIAFAATLVNIEKIPEAKTSHKPWRFILDTVLHQLPEIPNLLHHTLNVPILCDILIIIHLADIQLARQKKPLNDLAARYRALGASLLGRAEPNLPILQDFNEVEPESPSERLRFLAATFMTLNPAFWVRNAVLRNSLLQQGLILTDLSAMKDRYFIRLADFVTARLSHFRLRSAPVIQRTFFVFGRYKSEKPDMHASPYVGIEENVLVYFLQLLATDPIRKNQLHYFGYIHMPGGAIRHAHLFAASLLLVLRQARFVYEFSDEAARLRLRFFESLRAILVANQSHLPLGDVLAKLKPDELARGDLTWVRFSSLLGREHTESIDAIAHYLRGLPPENFQTFQELYYDIRNLVEQISDQERSGNTLVELANPGTIPRTVASELSELAEQGIAMLEKKGEFVEDLRFRLQTLRKSIETVTNLGLTFMPVFQSADVPKMKENRNFYSMPSHVLNNFDFRLWMAQSPSFARTIPPDTLPLLPPIVTASHAQYRGIIAENCSSLPLGKRLHDDASQPPLIADYLLFQVPDPSFLAAHRETQKSNILVVFGALGGESTKGEVTARLLASNEHLLTDLTDKWLVENLLSLLPDNGSLVIYRAPENSKNRIIRSVFTNGGGSPETEPISQQDIDALLETDFVACHTFLYMGHGTGGLEARSAGLCPWGQGAQAISVAYLRALFARHGAPPVTYLNCCFGSEDGLRNLFAGYAENPQIVAAFLDFGCRLALASPVPVSQYASLKRYFRDFVSLLRKSQAQTFAQNCLTHLASGTPLNFLDFLQIFGNPFCTYTPKGIDFQSVYAADSVAVFRLDIKPDL